MFLSNRYTLALMALALIMLMYLLLSDNFSYGISKTAFFVIKGLLPVLAVGSLSPLEKKDIRFVCRTIIIGAFLMVIKLYAFGDISAERATIGDEASPINVARTIGLGITLLSYELIFSRKRPTFSSLVTVLILGAACFAVLTTGARGPLFGILFGLVGVFLFLTPGVWSRLKVLMKTATLSLILLSSIWVLPLDIESYQGIKRIANYVNTIGDNTSDRSRIERYEVAIDGFVEVKGLGIGTGAFATLYGVEGRAYPHNLFLEVMVEQGIVGVAILIVILWLPLSRAVFKSLSVSLKEPIRPLTAMWFFALFNSFVSMDISGNSQLWVSGGLIYCLAQTSHLPVLSEAQE
jgi:hypothetical protein